MKSLSDLKKMPLADFCIQKLDYKAVKDKDSRLWRCLLSPTGHKIVTKSTPNNKGHYLFFCADEDIRGSVVDLLVSLHGFNMKMILKDFCDVILEFHAPKFKHRPAKKDPQKVTCDIKKQYNLYLQRCGASNNYLTLRGISPETINHFGLRVAAKEWFLPLYFLDENGSFQVATAIRYVLGLNAERKRYFLSGMEKRGAYSLLTPQNQELGYYDTIMLFESPVDALSYAQLYPQKRKAIYLSFCGSFGENFEIQLLRLIKKLEIKHVAICMDNDRAGRKYANRLSSLLRKIEVQTHFPFGKDWNEDLIIMKTNKELDF